MLSINSESVKRITNGDLIVRGVPEEIRKKKYEDGWYVVSNHRESEELEVERSGSITSVSSMVNVNRRLSYSEIIGNDWYILD